jgi:DNA invertase Pin-like site-specific DNA recombinase
VNHKILPPHLQRQAIIYLRQSTSQQVEFNRESTERQYALAQRAQDLGWDASQIQVFDGDLGKSGQSTRGRMDFHRLMAAVGLGEVGAVFALEASRLSRSQADWHKLLDICALTDTLVIDHDGIYNPNDFNDRVILGFKGTWSHTELHGIRLRLQGAKQHKANKGELRCTPPTGYVYDNLGQLVLDPDEGVVATIQLLFDQFRQLGTAFKVMSYFAQNQIPFPRRVWEPGNPGMLRWGSLNLSRILAILHNPTYTGTYVYGRRRSQPIIEAGQVTRVRMRQLPRDQWQVILHNTHPAYLSWEQFLNNEGQLQRNNVTLNPEGRQGSAREGMALLQGLIICGKCGRRMSPRYHGKGGKRVTYQCDQRRQKDGDSGICWSAAGAAIEVAVAEHVLSLMSANQLNLSLSVLEELEQVTQQQHQQWRLRLERAQYEVQRAERQFDAVEPENRLVARTLEKRWNEKLQQYSELEQAYAQAQRVQRLELSDEQRQQILQLSQDLPAVWHASTTTVQERKEMLRLLVKQISLTPINEPERLTKIQLLWHTDNTTEITSQRPTVQQRLGTPESVVQAIREVVYGHTDAEIAQLLNEKGMISATGQEFTASSVAWIRLKFKIPKPESDNRLAFHLGIREDGCYSTSALAEKLGVGIHTIHYWREKGIVPATRDTPHSPWWHPITPEILQVLRQKIRRVPLKEE